MKNRLENLLKYIDKLKTEVDSLRLLSQEQLSQIKDYYKIGLTYSSNALEGNTLTENETKIVIIESNFIKTWFSCNYYSSNIKSTIY